MFASMGLTLAGLFFMFVIIFVDLGKKKYNTLETKIYRLIVIITTFLLILEVCCVITMANRETVPLLNTILCRSYIFGTMLWFFMLVVYAECLLAGDKIKTFNDIVKNKDVIYMFLVAIVLGTISCTKPLEFFEPGKTELIYVICGKAVDIYYYGFALISPIIVKILFKDLNIESLIKRTPIFLFLVCFIILDIFQHIYQNINDLTFTFAVVVIAMYFTLENQDIKLAKDLEIAKKEAEEADKAKTEFLSRMSHEIRTPMNAIMGYTESLLNDKTLTEEEVKTDVQSIYNASKNLLEIINNILTYSRIESGKEKVEETEYALLDITNELESFVRSKLNQDKVTFNIYIDDEIPASYLGDKLKIYRILLNLISNSIKYTVEGEIDLTINCKIAEDNIAELIFEVRDTGLGMNEEELRKVFDELTVNNDDGKINGTGLGLVLTKKIIKLVEGEITFKSEFGIGTTFNIKVKQKVIGNSKIKDYKKSVEYKDIYFDCSDKRILIVDDNKLNLKVTEKQLKPYNINCDFANSGTECINKIKNGEKYDLIFLDHMMPELDGIETLKIIKRMDIKDIPPIIAMTANIITEEKNMYIEEGFSGYLAKPVETRDLNKLMNKYFKKAE